MHLQETQEELLRISDKLIDGDPSAGEVRALKARRLELIALKSDLEKASTGQRANSHQQGLMSHHQQATHSQVDCLSECSLPCTLVTNFAWPQS